MHHFLYVYNYDYTLPDSPFPDASLSTMVITILHLTWYITTI